MLQQDSVVPALSPHLRTHSAEILIQFVLISLPAFFVAVKHCPHMDAWNLCAGFVGNGLGLLQLRRADGCSKIALRAYAPCLQDVRTEIDLHWEDSSPDPAGDGGPASDASGVLG